MNVTASSHSEVSVPLLLVLREASRSIPYFCGEGVWDVAAQFLAERFPRHALALVTDDNVYSLYKDRLTALFAERSRFGVIVVPAGEASKTRAEKERVEDELFARNFGRDTLIVAVGGGVAGDLAGFVAATFNRGAPLVHFPTSLLAMTDSSVGGKTGVNHAAGKNLLGAFYHPEAIFADTATLATLPEREFINGMAEALKYAVTLDLDFWDFLETNVRAVRAREPEALRAVIARSAALKMSVVERDEKEAGLRAVLNFGHTFGHAFEHLSRYEIPHGFAVAAGMRAALWLSERLLGYPRERRERFDALLEAYDLKVQYSSRFEEEAIWSALAADKKSRETRPRFVLMRTPADCALSVEISREDAAEALAQFA